MSDGGHTEGKNTISTQVVARDNLRRCLGVVGTVGRDAAGVSVAGGGDGGGVLRPCQAVHSDVDSRVGGEEATAQMKIVSASATVAM